MISNDPSKWKKLTVVYGVASIQIGKNINYILIIIQYMCFLVEIVMENDNYG